MICKKCGRKVGVFDYGYDGICEMCWRETKQKKKSYDSNKQNINSNKENDSNQNLKIENTNKVALTIKVIAIIGVTIGIFYGAYLRESMYTKELGDTIIIASAISSVFIYAFGEIIQKLQNIEDNIRKINGKHS